MGTLTFHLPPDLSLDAAGELEHAGMLGGQDNMPYAAQVAIEPGDLIVSRNVEESGYVMAPWEVEGAGLLMTATPTVIERPEPYQLQVELARGKVNQVRAQSEDWLIGGLQMPPELAELRRQATRAFARAVSYLPSPEAGPHAQEALTLAFRAADQLVQAYVSQVFQVRHTRQQRLDTALGCRLGPAVPPDALVAPLLEGCNTLCVPFSWNEIEPAEADYHWEPYDQVLQWAHAQNLPVVGGPLVDFSTGRLPDWLWLWDGDISSLAGMMCSHVETVVSRYRGRIRTWQVCAASNLAGILSLGEDELLWLTVRLIEAARQVDPQLELIVGIAQPWGEYMTTAERNHSPFVFADTLIRSGLSLSALDLELVMAALPRGSYCRDSLEVSRLLDLYALLGVPLQVTLGYPAAEGADPHADGEAPVSGGRWHEGFTPEVQADWASSFAGLALCKPAVRSVMWANLMDSVPHQFPHCGLADAQDKPRSVLKRLRELRRKHLR
jgi:hypothetical protein